jgi:hypothetical protein
MTAADGKLYRTVSDYFAEGFWRQPERPGPPGKIGAYHRMLSAYVNTLTEVGLTLDRLSEPRATDRLAERRPIWREVPGALVARCWKAEAGG